MVGNYKTFRLHLTTNVKQNYHEYEIQWGFFNQPKPDFTVLGTGRFNVPDSPKKAAAELVAFNEAITGCRALVESVNERGSPCVLDERKLTDLEKKIQEEAAKRGEEHRRKQQAVFAETMQPGARA